MIDGLDVAHRRADRVMYHAAGIVLTGLAMWTALNQYAVNQATDGMSSVPFRVAVTPQPVAFSPAEMDQSDCLAEALYYEARGEGTEGEKAVAEVVLQRTRDSNY